MWVIRKESIIAYFFPFPLLTDLKINYIKQYEYNYIVGSIIYRNIKYLTITAQRNGMGRELYSNKEMTLDGNSNSQKEMERTVRMLVNTINIYLFSFFSQHYFIFLFTFVFWPHYVACGMLSWPGIKPGHPQWKCWILTTKPSAFLKSIELCKVIITAMYC